MKFNKNATIFIDRDRGTIKYPVAFYTPGEHSTLWVSETRRI